MDKKILMNRLKAKPDLNLFIVEAIENTAIINSLFEIVLTETSSIKYACTKIIRMVSEQKPELIYPYFEDIVKWLHHKNSFIKWDGILVLSNLAAVDCEDKFGGIYQDYLSLIQDSQMITAANVVGNAWKIVRAKPELETYITRKLLEVPKIIYMNKDEPSPECNYIVCGQVLECFEHYFDYSGDQAAMINFAEGQMSSRRKAVAKIAEKFLRNHSRK
ncbi:MAG: hypothetical protein SCM11_06690 [Bacillota bacterium]|nr:hypothetical protein [Bacillota bacterium]